jgi:hypothetical protein
MVDVAGMCCIATGQQGAGSVMPTVREISRERDAIGLLAVMAVASGAAARSDSRDSDGGRGHAHTD